MSTPRRDLIDRLKARFGNVRNRRYMVRRGPVDWASHRFTDEEPFAVAIHVDEAHPFRSEGMLDMVITVEMATTAEGEEIDDDVIDALHADFVDVFRGLQLDKNSEGDSVALKIAWDEATSQEDFDAERKHQGITIQIAVSY